MAPAPQLLSSVDLLMDRKRHVREQKRQRQLGFYATFLPSSVKPCPTKALCQHKGLSRAAVAKLLEEHRKSVPARVEAHARSVFLQREI